LTQRDWDSIWGAINSKIAEVEWKKMMALKEKSEKENTVFLPPESEDLMTNTAWQQMKDGSGYIAVRSDEAEQRMRDILKGDDLGSHLTAEGKLVKIVPVVQSWQEKHFPYIVTVYLTEHSAGKMSEVQEDMLKEMITWTLPIGDEVHGKPKVVRHKAGKLYTIEISDKLRDNIETWIDEGGVVKWGAQVLVTKVSVERSRGTGMITSWNPMKERRPRERKITAADDYSEEEMDEGVGEAQGQLVTGRLEFPDINEPIDSSGGAIPKKREIVTGWVEFPGINEPIDSSGGAILKKKEKVVKVKETQLSKEEKVEKIQEIRDEIMQQVEREEDRRDEDMEKLQKRKLGEEKKRKAKEGVGTAGKEQGSVGPIVRNLGNFSITELRQKTPSTGFVRSKGTGAFEKYTPSVYEIATRKERNLRYMDWYNKELKRQYALIEESLEGETEHLRNFSKVAARMIGKELYRAEKLRNWRRNQREALTRADRDIENEENEILADREYWLKELRSREKGEREMLRQRQASLEQAIERARQAGKKGGAGTSKTQVEPSLNPAPDPVAEQETEEEEEDEGDKGQEQYKSTEDRFY
jgi:hypothetical protein